MSKEKSDNKISSGKSDGKSIQKPIRVKRPPDYPGYRPKDDIYKEGKEETDLGSENTSKTKSLNKKNDGIGEKDFGSVATGGDLDIPSSELENTRKI